jgi:putative NIF3 family GTP cyclohydrolase 1 type 2
MSTKHRRASAGAAARSRRRRAATVRRGGSGSSGGAYCQSGPAFYNGRMLLAEFDALVRATLDLNGFEHDVAINGLQVARSGPAISKAAFAVDASLESFRRAVAAGGELLFVHHGLFWGSQQPLRGTLYERVRFLVQNDLALYAVHLPLDAHPELGNNIGIARRLGLTAIEPFGVYHGMRIGFKGRLPEPQPLERLAALISARPLSVLPFGRSDVGSVGIVSGGDPHAVSQAITRPRRGG